MYPSRHEQFFVAAGALAVILATAYAAQDAGNRSLREISGDASSRSVAGAMAVKGGITPIVARSLLPIQDARAPRQSGS